MLHTSIGSMNESHVATVFVRGEIGRKTWSHLLRLIAAWSVREGSLQGSVGERRIDVRVDLLMLLVDLVSDVEVVGDLG
jgi:hypothetical protein